ncbi:MAG: cytochrome c oxidase assembly factor 1 family protein [Magnetovibrio sp.]|nr:cytochrome c oxidase assembly factor 1 family protein [Magnetovibrio sp.]
MQNDNSVVRRPRLPDELRGWNWGAFFLNWVWGLGHNTWIALLMFVPGINLVMPFVLGAKGNEWAWQNNDWRDIAHFKRSQRIWARVGIGAFLGIPLFISLIVWGVITLFNSSDAYLLTLEELRHHPRLERPMGHPVVPSGWLTLGNIQMQNSDGWAELNFGVEGPRAVGKAEVYLERQNSVWTIKQLYVKTERGEEIWLVE